MLGLDDCAAQFHARWQPRRSSTQPCPTARLGSLHPLQAQIASSKCPGHARRSTTLQRPCFSFVCFARCLCLIRLYRYPSRSVLQFDATGVRVEANRVAANRPVKGTISAAMETAQASMCSPIVFERSSGRKGTGRSGPSRCPHRSAERSKLRGPQ